MTRMIVYGLFPDNYDIDIRFEAVLEDGKL
jgi:hypothetical protein